MVKVIQKKGESSKKYLVRVAIVMLEQGSDFIDTVKFDDAECDASCLADDLRIEFNLPDADEDGDGDDEDDDDEDEDDEDEDE